MLHRTQKVYIKLSEMTAIVLHRPKYNSVASNCWNASFKADDAKKDCKNTKCLLKMPWVPKLCCKDLSGTRGGSVGDQRGAAEAVREIQGGSRKAENRHFHCTIGIMWFITVTNNDRNDRTARVGEGAVIIILSGLKESAATLNPPNPTHKHTHTYDAQSADTLMNSRSMEG